MEIQRSLSVLPVALLCAVLLLLAGCETGADDDAESCTGQDYAASCEGTRTLVSCNLITRRVQRIECSEGQVCCLNPAYSNVPNSRYGCLTESSCGEEGDAGAGGS